ncbi:MAG: hypothetical protein CME16_02650 [Gemmatimonadetes bacterium]|nr:hypothetical protein [Gemmatimonadota bacterium]
MCQDHKEGLFEARDWVVKDGKKLNSTPGSFQSVWKNGAERGARKNWWVSPAAMARMATKDLKENGIYEHKHIIIRFLY